jgi:hypothetical protein
LKTSPLLAVLALVACTAVHADYDAKMEAQEAAQRKAAAAADAKNKADAKRQRDATQAQGMRQFLGKEAVGKSDAEVKVLYDAKMGAYIKQAKEAEKAYGNTAK